MLFPTCYADLLSYNPPFPFQASQRYVREVSEMLESSNRSILLYSSRNSDQLLFSDTLLFPLSHRCE